MIDLEDAAKPGAPKIWDDDPQGNVAYGLKLRGKSAEEMKQRVEKELAQIGLGYVFLFFIAQLGTEYIIAGIIAILGGYSIVTMPVDIFP